MEVAISDMSPEEARKLIDEEIVKLHSRCSPTPLKTRRETFEHASNINPIDASKSKLPFLRTLRNTYAPISKLPNEILVQVFTIAEHPDEISQTCQHWRFLAVGTPALWTHPPTHLHDNTLRFLDRSKNSPLDIQIIRGTKFATASAVLEHIQRIRTLHVEQARSYLSNIQKVRRSAPRLEELYIEAQWPGDSFETFTFSPAAFGVTTKLRKLELENVCFHWCILPLPALTHLSLHDVTVTHDVTGVEFTSTLRGMPFLQELSMSFGDIELREYSRAFLFEPIDLPQLTGLDIRPRSHRDQIDHFLAHATLPRLHKLDVDYGDFPVDYSPMVQNLASTIQKGDFYPFECLAITSEHIRITPLLFSCDGPYIEIFLPVTHEDLDTDDFTMATHILSCVTSCGSKDFLNSSSLVQLAIGSLDLTSDELRQLFGGLPRLEHVEFSWKLAAPFVEALSIALNHPPDSPIYFSCLTSIEWCGHGFHNYPYPDPELFYAFIDCLMQRCEYGAPIHNVVLRRCNLVTDHVESKLLKEIVADVIVSSSWS